MSNTTTDRASTGGCFVVFEGVEGAGKSTHVRRVAERLDRCGIAYLLVREPGGTEVGERARQLVLDPRFEMGPEAELFLYLAARAEFVRRLARPALERGELVLADRYQLSTFAYQGRGRGLDLDLVRQVNRVATGGLEPDLTLLLSVDPEVGRSRQRGRPDRIEGERADFHRVVADAYNEFAAADDRTIRIVADAPHDVVHERIWNELATRWPERFPAASARAGNISAPGEFHECEPPARGGLDIESTGQEAE